MECGVECGDDEGVMGEDESSVISVRIMSMIIFYNKP